MQTAEARGVLAFGQSSDRVERGATRATDVRLSMTGRRIIWRACRRCWTVQLENLQRVAGIEGQAPC